MKASEMTNEELAVRIEYTADELPNYGGLQCANELRTAAARLRKIDSLRRRLKVAEDALTDLQSRLVASVYDGSMNPYEALKVAEDALAAIREEGATK